MKNPERPAKKKPREELQELRPYHDQLITLLLQGSTQRAAAEEVGLSEQQVSRLIRSVRFKSEFRRRRAAIIEGSDALLAAVDTLASAVLITTMKYHEWQTIEVPTKNGGTKPVRVPPELGLALQAAREVKRLNRDRIEIDDIASRLDRLEQKMKHSQGQE
ncbi:MAG: hypothetical protein U0796_15000 [Gemmatales bacterium]